MAKLVRQWVKFSLRYNLNEQNINKQISTARYLKQLLLSQSSLLFPRDTTSLYAVNNSRKKNSLVTHEQKSVLCPGGAGGGGGEGEQIPICISSWWRHIIIFSSSGPAKRERLERCITGHLVQKANITMIRNNGRSVAVIIIIHSQKDATELSTHAPQGTPCKERYDALWVLDSSAVSTTLCP